MWLDYFKYEYAVYNETLILKSTAKNKNIFFAPLGKDFDGAYKQIEEYCIQKGQEVKLTCVSQCELKNLQERYKGLISYSYNRDYSDYLYSYEEIENFVGKKFSGQRNHINGFKKNYPNYKYKKITKKDLPKILEFLKEYKTYHKDMRGVEKSEFINAERLTKNIFKGDFVGGYIEVDGKIASYSIGEYVDNMLIIHIEKGLPKYKGVYPLTFNEFVKNNKKEGVTLINREDDAGDMGLRTSKTQYHPIFMGDKYFVVIKKPMPKIKKPRLVGENIILEKIKKEDSLNYFKLYTQASNNKFWGDNYKDYVTDVSPNGFYNYQLNDYKKKNNMCLAIRHKLTRELIGEVIFYNFGYDKTVEIGLRLFKKYQNKGFGSEALYLAIKYSENVLKLNVKYKCFKQNIPSKKLAEKCGLKMFGEDEKYYFFRR